MNRLLLVLTIALSISAVVFVTLRVGEEEPTTPATYLAPGTPADDRQDVETTTVDASATKTPPAADDGSVGDTGAATPAEVAGDDEDPNAKALRVAAERRKPYCARRLDWDPNDPRLQFVAEWITLKWAEDAEFFDEISRVSDREKPAAMRRFNEATDARRIALIQRLGVDAARDVSEEWCLYHFDPDAMNWHRIDVAGVRVPFQHEDDSIWSGGELSTRSWGNHR